jgi:hypothetical protein
MTDNDPQFSAENFSDFAREWGFSHVTSSPAMVSLQKQCPLSKEYSKKRKKATEIHICLF